MSNEKEDHSTRVKRLRFRSWHRGFKEADLILGQFADSCLDAMSEAEVDRFEHLLDQTDREIYNWISGEASVPAEFDNDIMARLQRLDFMTEGHNG